MIDFTGKSRLYSALELIEDVTKDETLTPAELLFVVRAKELLKKVYEGRIKHIGNKDG